MTIDRYSLLLHKAIDAFAGLPGVGRKSALRLSLFLLKQDKEFTRRFTEDLNSFVNGIHFCNVCHNISDDELCSVCASPDRDHQIICVVESVREVIAIERTGQFKGLYHVLGGLISPMDGVGVDDLFLADLKERVIRDDVQEVLLALSATMEGDTTNFYIYRQLQDMPVRITTIARGVAIGDELEYADDVTLARSIEHRIDFMSTLRR